MAKALRDVSLDEVDFVLQTFHFELFHKLTHLFAVVIAHLIGLEAHLLAGLHIHEDVGSVFEFEIQFLGFVRYVKEDDLVLVMFEVLEGRKELVVIGTVFEHVAENDDQ